MKFKIAVFLLGIVLAFSLAGCSNSSGDTFAAQYIRTNATTEGEYPSVTVINSKSELTDYYEANKGQYDLERRKTIDSDTSIGFLDAADEYTDEFFKDKTLVIVVLEEGSGSITHTVTNVILSDNSAEIKIKPNVPEVGTADMAQWHILIELPKIELPSNAINVTITE